MVLSFRNVPSTLHNLLHYLKQKKTDHISFLTLFACNRMFHTKCQVHTFNNEQRNDFPSPELDLEYLCHPSNTDSIRLNIKKRKGIGNIDRVLELNEKFNKLKEKNDISELDKSRLKQIQDELLFEASRIPNRTHPSVMINNTENPTEVDSVGNKARFKFAPKTFHLLAKNAGILRIEHLPIFCGEKSYCFKGNLAMLEQALVQLSVERLIQKGFHLISVPDIVHPLVVEACGMPIKGTYTQVYHVEPIGGMPACLSGTAEVALASYFMGSKLSFEELPQKMIAVSRCYRAEAGGTKNEKGLYRVHQFTKVEMFGVAANETGDESEQMLNEFVSIQKTLFTDIGLHFKVLDMPPSDLAAAAYRKYDIEAWMPGRGKYGEISSASNCTDYQSRRLHIKYYSQDGILKHAHTINGTACAVPRLLIAIFGTFQNKNGSITIPEILRPYMNGLEKIEKSNAEILYFIKGREKVTTL